MNPQQPRPRPGTDHTEDLSPLWEQVRFRFNLSLDSLHGPRHWRQVERNGLHLCQFHEADPWVIRLFALFHDSCRENEWEDPCHGPRGADLAAEFRRAGHFQLDDARMDLLTTACRIHNGSPPHPNPTIGVCLDADRLDLGRVGIVPDPELLSTTTARSIASRGAFHELDRVADPD
ncbi:MAG: hypothetical protein KDN05_24940 [Verrucomicrobiae bacterium]|nr:hypothetical protein [Verrucomicrobiae bacterium]